MTGACGTAKTKAHRERVAHGHALSSESRGSGVHNRGPSTGRAKQRNREVKPCKGHRAKPHGRRQHSSDATPHSGEGRWCFSILTC